MPPSRLSGGAICRWGHDQDSAVDLPDRRHGIDAPQPSSHRVSGVHMGLRPHTAESRAPRPYHSVAFLAPHGEVITAGSNPARKTEDRRIEIYWPPYLFHGSRPSPRLDSGTAALGGTVTATVSPPVHEITMMRPSACTHSCDNEQRLLDVSFRSSLR